MITITTGMVAGCSGGKGVSDNDRETYLAFKNLPAGNEIVCQYDLTSRYKAANKKYVDINTIVPEKFQFPYDKSVSVDNAISVETLEETEEIYNAQLSLAIEHEIRKGDVLLLTFYIRSIHSTKESGLASLSLHLRSVPDVPAERMFTFAPPVSEDWKQIFIPMQSKLDYEAGKSQIAINVGYGRQTFEIAGFRLINYSNAVAYRDLPATRIRYEGFDGNEKVAWRTEAEKRIDEIRKGDVSVKILSEDGQPVHGAIVRVDMKRHYFNWGTAVHHGYIFGSSPDELKYQAALRKYFNTVVFETAIRWNRVENDFQTSKNTYNWVAGYGFDMKGHFAVMERETQFNERARQLYHAGEFDELKKVIREHVGNLVSCFNGRLIQWDVLNEPLDDHILYDIFGNEERAEWFKLAKKADCSALLFLNEMGINGGISGDRRVERLKALVRELQGYGAPVEGIGLQCHFGAAACYPPDFYRQIDSLAELGLPIAITEYDIVSDDEELQAAFLRDILILTFSHPDIVSFYMWGFWDGNQWKKNAPLFRKDWSMKPSGKEYARLVFEEWWTNATGKTNRKGSFKTRGFYGEYDIFAEYLGKTYKTVFYLVPGGGNQLVITIGEGKTASFRPEPYVRPRPAALTSPVYPSE